MNENRSRTKPKMNYDQKRKIGHERETKKITNEKRK